MGVRSKHMNASERLGIAALITGVIAVGYSWYSNVKVKKAYELIEESVEQMSKTIHVEVSRSIVDMAIDKAVCREVNAVVYSLSRETIRKVSSALHNEVKDSVDKSFSNIKTSVTKEIRDQVSNIDISDLKQEIKDEAKEKVISKFDDDLDSLLEEFNQNLQNVSKIYNSIADSMSQKPQLVLKTV